MRPARRSSDNTHRAAFVWRVDPPFDEVAVPVRHARRRSFSWRTSGIGYSVSRSSGAQRGCELVKAAGGDDSDIVAVGDRHYAGVAGAGDADGLGDGDGRGVGRQTSRWAVSADDERGTAHGDSDGMRGAPLRRRHGSSSRGCRHATMVTAQLAVESTQPPDARYVLRPALHHPNGYIEKPQRRDAMRKA